MRKTVLSTVVVSGVLLAATASLAASDYYLKFEGVDGASRSGSMSQTIELRSWAFGASQPQVVSPRDPTSAARTSAPAAAELQTVVFSVPEPGDASIAALARMCASGKNIRNAVLNSPDGRYKLEDTVITSCAVTGNERRYEFRGHVTLMK